MKQNFFKKGIAVFIVVAMMILSLPVDCIELFASEIEDEIYLDVPVEVIVMRYEKGILYFTPVETGIYHISFDSAGEDIDAIDVGVNVTCDDEIIVSGGGSWDFSLMCNMIEGNTYEICYAGPTCEGASSFSSYIIEVSKSNIASIEFEDTFVIEGYDRRIDYEYSEETGQYDLEWLRYDYYPVIVVTNDDGSTETFTNVCYIEGLDTGVSPEYYDTQSYYDPWETGNTYTVTASLFGITDTFEVEVIESPVDRLEVSTVTFVDGEYNGSGGEYIDGDEYVEYEYYYLEPDCTVYFKDGCSESVDCWSDFEYNGREFWLSTWDDQSYYNQWAAGEHTAYASFMGYETMFTVNIVATPIIDLAVEDISMTVGTGGYFTTDWDEDGNEIEWYYYNLFPSYTVTYADGTTETFADGEAMYFNGEYYWPSIYNDQSCYNQWSIGTYSVVFSIFGIETTFDVEITDSPVVSLEVENVVLTEGESIFVNSGIDENGNFCYCFQYNYYPHYTVTFNDGRTETVPLGEGIMYDGEYYYVTGNDGQSFETPWGVGEHTVTVSFMGFESSFTVEIIESPIVGLYVDDVSLVYETGGYFTGIWDEEGNYTSQYIYSYYPDFTVVFNDGTTQTVENGGSVSFEGEYYHLYTCDAQHYGNAWGIGNNAVYAYIGGIETEFFAEVTETPIVGIVYNNIDLTENLDGYADAKYNPETGEYDISYFRYEYTPSCIVLLNDGTVLYSENGAVEYCGESYFIETSDTQEEREWSVGTHTVTASLLGYEKSFNVTVKENPYNRLEISGTTELILTLFKNDGTKESVNVISFDMYFWGGELQGTLKTTGGDFPVRGTYYVSEDGEDQPERALILSIGAYTTNTLSGNLWMKMLMIAENYEYNINMYRWFADSIFAGFDGAVDDDNIEHIITLAAWMCGDIYNEGDMIWGDEWAYHYVSLDTIKANIEEVFGITDVDFTKYSLYDPCDPENIRIHYLGGGGGGPKEITLYFKDGKWVYESLTEYNNYNELRIVMNEEAQIESIIIDSGELGKEPVSTEIASMPHKVSYMMGELIDLRGISLKITYSDGTSEIVTSSFRTAGFDSESAGEKIITVIYGNLTTSFAVTVEEGMLGDINGDGVVNAKDSNVFKRVISGAISIEAGSAEFKAVDLDFDGVLNGKDSYILKRMIAGSVQM